MPSQPTWFHRLDEILGALRWHCHVKCSNLDLVISV